MMHDNLSSGCLLPLAQSIVTGILAGLLAYCAGAWWGAANLAYLALTVGAGAGVAVWLAGLRRWQLAAYPEPFYPAEPARADEEPAEPQHVKLELTQDQGRQVQLIDLPASVDQLTALAKGLLTGATLAESQWTGAGGLFTRAQFAALRSALIRRGLAAWNSPGTPARGVMLTAPGRAAMRHFASMAGAEPGTLQRRDREPGRP